MFYCLLCCGVRAMLLLSGAVFCNDKMNVRTSAAAVNKEAADAHSTTLFISQLNKQHPVVRGKDPSLGRRRNTPKCGGVPTIEAFAVCEHARSIPLGAQRRRTHKRKLQEPRAVILFREAQIFRKNCNNNVARSIRQPRSPKAASTTTLLCRSETSHEPSGEKGCFLAFLSSSQPSVRTCLALRQGVRAP